MAHGRDVGGKEASPETLRTYASRLRKLIGAHRFPPAPAIGGYQFVTGVTTDLDMFKADVAAAGAEPAGAMAHLGAALNFVRGAPFEFEGSHAASRWALGEFHFSHTIEVVTEAAHRLVGLLADAGHVARARGVARQGLRICSDRALLHEDRLRLAADPGERQAAWHEAVTNLGAIEAERVLGATFRRLTVDGP